MRNSTLRHTRNARVETRLERINIELPGTINNWAIRNGDKN